MCLYSKSFPLFNSQNYSNAIYPDDNTSSMCLINSLNQGNFLNTAIFNLANSLFIIILKT